MVSLVDWLKDLSENYSVHRFDDVESGTFVAKVKDDVYLMNHAEGLKKKCWINIIFQIHYKEVKDIYERDVTCFIFHHGFYYWLYL